MELVEWLVYLSKIGYLLLIIAILWVFGRMGDNINKIRKLLEQEIEYNKRAGQ